MARSYELMVRDAIYDRVKLMPFFRDFHFAKTKTFQVQPEMHLPYIGIYFLNESMSPDGNANHGEVRFKTVARIGFSVIVEYNNPDTAEEKLDEAYMALMTELMTLPANGPMIYNMPQFKIESFAYADRMHSFGMEGETPFAEMRLNLACDLGAITWEPVITDVFETLHIETIFPLGGTPEEIEAVQQVKATWDIETEPEP